MLGGNRASGREDTHTHTHTHQEREVREAGKGPPPSLPRCSHSSGLSCFQAFGILAATGISCPRKLAAPWPLGGPSCCSGPCGPLPQSDGVRPPQQVGPLPQPLSSTYRLSPHVPQRPQLVWVPCPPSPSVLSPSSPPLTQHTDVPRRRKCARNHSQAEQSREDRRCDFIQKRHFLPRGVDLRRPSKRTPTLQGLLLRPQVNRGKVGPRAGPGLLPGRDSGAEQVPSSSLLGTVHVPSPSSASGSVAAAWPYHSSPVPLPRAWALHCLRGL